jgi:hypothetical protein
MVTVSGIRRTVSKIALPIDQYKTSCKRRKIPFKATTWKKLLTTIERPVHNANPASKLWITIVQMLRVKTVLRKKVTRMSTDLVNRVLISLRRTISTMKTENMTKGILRKYSPAILPSFVLQKSQTSDGVDLCSEKIWLVE